MNSYLKHFLAAAVALFVALPAFGQQQVITIATGGEKGTYHAFFQNIETVCGESPKYQLIEKLSKGCDQNLDLMIKKQVDAAFCQADTLQFVSLTDPRASQENIRVLFPLYPEEVHVVGLRDLSKTVGGLNIGKFNLMGNKQQLDNLGDLSGLKVGAWGGSVTTARTIAHMGSVKYDVEPFGGDKEAFAALDKGEVAALIIVGGQPMSVVEGLSRTKYKLLKIDGGLAGRVKVYQNASISYSNLDAAGVETVSARSMLLVKNYATPERREAFAALKTCLTQNLSRLRETSGFHVKWDSVSADAEAVWPRYDTGSVKVAAPVQPAAPAKKR